MVVKGFNIQSKISDVRSLWRKKRGPQLDKRMFVELRGLEAQVYFVVLNFFQILYLLKISEI